MPTISSSNCTNSGNNTASSSWGITLPAYSAGDLIVVNLVWDDSTTTTGHNIPSGPNGETPEVLTIGTFPYYTTSERASVWFWVATDAYAGGTLTVTPTASESWTGTVLVVAADDFDADFPIGAWAAAGTASAGTSHASAAFTAGADEAGGALVTWVGLDAHPTTSTPSGWTECANVDRGDIAGTLAVRDSATTASESISSASWGTSSSTTCSVISYVVRDAAPAWRTAVSTKTAAANDNAHYNHATSYFNLGATILYVQDTGTNTYGNAARWQLNVPKDATITAAKIMFAERTADLGRYDAGDYLTVGFEQVDNAAQHDTGANYATRYANQGTTRNVYLTGPGRATGNARVGPFDVDPESVQELVNRAGWSANQYVMAFLYSPAGAAYSNSWWGHAGASDAKYYPRLVVFYGDAEATYDGTGASEATASESASADWVLSGYPAEVHDDSPHLWYRLGETSGTSVDDAAGTNDGTASGTYDLNVAGAGNTGSAIDFTAGKVESGDLSLTGEHDLTVETWLNLDANPNATSTPDSVFLLWIDESGNLAFQVRDSEKTTWAVASTTKPSTGGWHHVVGVWDRTAQVARLYLDGSLANSSSAQSFSNIGALSEPLVVGDGEDGTFDEVALYTTALSGARISAHYAAGRESITYDGAGTAVATASESGAAAATAPASGAEAGTASDAATASAVFAAVGASAAEGITTAAAGGVAASTSGSDAASASDSAAGVSTLYASGSSDATASETGVAERPAETEDATGSVEVTASVAGAAQFIANATGAGEAAASEVGAAERPSETRDATGSSEATGSVVGAAEAVFAGSGAAEATASVASDGASTLYAVGAAAATASEVGTAERPNQTADATGASAVAASESAGAVPVTAAGSGASAGAASESATATAVFAGVGASEATASVAGAVVAEYGAAGAVAADASEVGAGALTADASGTESATASDFGEGLRLIAFVMTPSALVSATGIVDQDGLTADLHQAIDESMSSPDDDTTYLVNSASASGSAWVTLAEVPAGLEAVTRYGVRVRARREA